MTRDYLAGAESFSGRKIPVECPKCGLTHLVGVSVIGRFLFLCKATLVGGEAPADVVAEIRADRARPC